MSEIRSSDILATSGIVYTILTEDYRWATPILSTMALSGLKNTEVCPGFTEPGGVPHGKLKAVIQVVVLGIIRSDSQRFDCRCRRS